MSTNYDSSQVGVPYVRANKIIIDYSETGMPEVVVEQALAVKLADGTIREFDQIQSFSLVLNLQDTTPIPLVDPTTGANLGANTTLGQVMLGILAVIRKNQLTVNP